MTQSIIHQPTVKHLFTDPGGSDGHGLTNIAANESEIYVLRCSNQ